MIGPYCAETKTGEPDFLLCSGSPLKSAVFSLPVSLGQMGRAAPREQSISWNLIYGIYLAKF